MDCYELEAAKYQEGKECSLRVKKNTLEKWSAVFLGLNDFVNIKWNKNFHNLWWSTPDMKVKKYFQTKKTSLARSFSSNMHSSYQTAGHSGVELQLSIMNWWRGPQGLTPCQTPVPTYCASLPLISFSVQASMGALRGAKLFGGHILSIPK